MEKEISIGAQQLTKNLGSYLIRCGIMIRGLFEVCGAHEQNEICLNKELNQSMDDLKAHTTHVEEITKNISEI